MRIFERLRGRSRSESAIESKLFEAVTNDLLQKLEDETSIPVFTIGAHLLEAPDELIRQRRLSGRRVRPEPKAPAALAFQRRLDEAGMKECGSPGRIRTSDHSINSRTLYH